MTTERYRAMYRDARGPETIEIVNERPILRTSIRGIVFEGRDFDALDAKADEADVRAAGLTVAKGALCACELRWVMPIGVSSADSHEVGRLDVYLILGEPRPTGGIDREVLRLRLECSHATVASAGTSGWFEDELLDLQRQLPESVYLRACIGCGLSDYSPA